MLVRSLFWLLLATPGLALLISSRAAGADLDQLTAESGEWAARLLIAALAVTPLVHLWPALSGLKRHRRAIGLAAFGHALLHLGFYGVAMGGVDVILDELAAPGIWTGWAALALLLPLALTSSNAAMRVLRHGWKRLQRLAYPAAVLTLAHWLLVHDGIIVALTHAAPLVLLELTRLLPPRPFTRRSPA